MSEIRDKLELVGPQLDEATRQKIGWLIDSRVTQASATRVQHRKKRDRPRGSTPGVTDYPPAHMIKTPARNAEPIEAPVNEVGLIDIDDWVRQVKHRVRSSHRWSRNIMVAHFYFPSADYDFHPVARSFRDLPKHKAVVPRDFENFFHDNAAIPTLPSLDVMHEVIGSWKVTKDTFQLAKELAWWEKRDENYHLMRWFRGVDPNVDVQLMRHQPSSTVAGIQNRLRDGLDENMATMLAVPPEVRVIDVSEAPTSPLELATFLGRVVAPSALTLTEKIAA